jgi:hypothetical protein
VRNRKSEKGSTLLIELLIVCVVILTLVGMATTSTVKLVQVSDQNAAISILRNVSQAEGWMFRIYSPNGYETPQYLANSEAGAVGMVAMTSCQTPGLLGAERASIFSVPSYYGYQFAFIPGPTSTTTNSNCTSPGLASYQMTADPVSSATGQFHFFIDQSGILRWNASGPATAASPTW